VTEQINDAVFVLLRHLSMQLSVFPKCDSHDA